MDYYKCVWDMLAAELVNPCAVAAVMGNLEAESGISPKNLQNSYEDSLGFCDEEYTRRVDNGTYTNFVHDCAGYGIAQWTYWSRKEALLNYAKSRGTSVGNLSMQIAFLLNELRNSYKAVLEDIISSSNLYDCTVRFMCGFERPADQTDVAKNYRYSLANRFYSLYANTATGTTEVVYTVKSGDTLSAIGKKYGIAYSVIAEYNGIKNPDLIYIGQRIKIPTK